MSGLRLFPMMGGLLVASIGSGQIVSRWGRYKVFPVVGTALMTVGLYLMSLVGVATGAWAMSAYMFVFGVGLGPGDAGAGGGGAERRPLRGAGHGHLGSDVLPHDRRVLRHRGLRGHLRQPAGRQRPPRSSTCGRAPAEAHQLRATTPAPWRTCPRPCTPGSSRAWRTPSRRSSSSGCPIAVGGLPLQLAPARGAAAQVDPHGRHRRGLRRARGSAPRSRSCSIAADADCPAREPGRALPHPGASGPASTSPPGRVWLLYRLADRPDCTLEGLGLAELQVDPDRIEPRGRRSGRGRSGPRRRGRRRPSPAS